MHPILDKAEVAIDFPDKFYMGSFGRDCGFEARADAEGVSIKLVRPSGEKRIAHMHLHYLLFAAILDDLAESVPAPAIDDVHRLPLRDAARRLAAALDREAPHSA
jgi:hypothetical protein